MSSFPAVDPIQMIARAHTCFTTCWNKLPHLETPEQRKTGMFSTTRKVLSCLPWIGTFMGMVNAAYGGTHKVSVDRTKQEAWETKVFISLSRYMVASTLGLVALRVAGLVTLGFFSGCSILFSALLVGIVIKEIGRQWFDLKAGL